MAVSLLLAAYGLLLLLMWLVSENSSSLAGARAWSEGLLYTAYGVSGFLSSGTIRVLIAIYEKMEIVAAKLAPSDAEDAAPAPPAA